MRNIHRTGLLSSSVMEANIKAASTVREEDKNRANKHGPMVLNT